MSGRVGDSPILGAGLYVDNEIGAAGSTGRGEANLLACSSVMIVENMRQGKSPERACLMACERIAHLTKESRLRRDNGRPKFNVTFYTIDKKSEFGSAAIWSGSRFVINDGQSESRLADSAYLYKRKIEQNCDGRDNVMGAYVDVSDRTLLSMKGVDSQDLLQRISTNDLARLQTGGMVETILTNEKGRIIDTLVVHKGEGNEFLLAGRSKAPNEIMGWLNKFIIMEDISVTSVMKTHAQLQTFDISYQKVSSCLSTTDCLILRSGYRKNELVRIVVEVGKRYHLNEILHAHGINQQSDQEYESFRVDQGIPDWPNELCDRYNPLELGLEHRVSFTKGCYVGQEVIARLDTYKKVQKRIVRLGLESNPPSLPSVLFSGDEEAGVITSSASRIESNHESAAIGFLDKGTDTSKVEFYYLSDTLRKSAYLLLDE